MKSNRYECRITGTESLIIGGGATILFGQSDNPEIFDEFKDKFKQILDVMSGLIPFANFTDFDYRC